MSRTDKAVAGEPSTVAIVLARNAIDSRVLIDGVDITRSVVGVEVRAFVNELSKVTITLSCRAEITGDAEVVQVKP